MTRSLQLTRPLISFDLETTGLNVQEDRVIEISCVKIFPDHHRETLSYRLNPERPISPDAQAVHGLSDADVAACPTFRERAQHLHAFMADCDVTGFNVERFDMPMLRQEFARVQLGFPHPGTQVIDSWRIFCHFEPRDLTAAYQYFCGKTLENAHNAEADATAAADILLAQLGRYEALPLEVAGLHAFCHPVRPDWVDTEGKVVWLGDEAAINFGKHRGRTLRQMADTEPDYLRWVAHGNFSDEVQQVCRQALVGEFPVRAGAAAEAPPAAAEPLASVPADAPHRASEPPRASRAPTQRQQPSQADKQIKLF